ncbi:hypothetical protein PAXRUDRAFT_36981 [Paxillus rubicundulus Ve08.2h10]|uniref:Uncharacterized protein n=1 Tax=Paxillus rubicundulus Ve08.2h10 TaxID=930991 RepID=A0A0D0CWL9_9AGAM|nr:hypothetical protein PAXRUDRAFT_36981 [Paxillus rubicundulus Ve08.2h10]
MDPSQLWYNPATSFAYSLGEPKGSRGGLARAVYCNLLQDSEGNQVPCRESHATCNQVAGQGCKACSYADQTFLSTPHHHASRGHIQSHLYSENLTLSAQVLKKTHTFWAALQKNGCGTLPDPSPTQSRTYDRSDNRLHCEFYDEKGIRDHLVHYGPESGEYDIGYLQALFNEDMDEINAIELEARQCGFDPAAPCPTIMNHTSVRVTCPRDHCDENRRPQLGSMVSITCCSLFWTYQPLQEYQQACPKVLVVCSGVHTHPIPLPTKTPLVVRSQILSLLHEMDYNLPDMTPRRFLRHTSIKSYLQTRFPPTVNPALSDLHISLANRLLNIKEIQDRTLPNHHHYIWLAVEVLQAELLGNCELDNEGDHDDTSTPLHVSDIAFKWVAGFQEFKLGGNDPKSNLTLTYCRIFVTHQSAAAHQFIFHALEQIVELDTGSKLMWQHLHATNLNDLMGILQWMGDQHRGQAKGLGLHLQWLAQQIPDHFDLHQPDCLLSTLDEYDHLRRVFQLCSIHIYQNIKTSHVEESVKNMMWSLVCMEHPDFTGTMEKIEQDGGKPGADTTRQRKLTAQDAKLKILNVRLEKAKTSLDRAQSHVRIEGHAIRPDINSSTSLT